MPNLDLDLQKILDQTSFSSTITGMVELNGVLYFTVNSSISPNTAKVGLWKFENGIYSAIEHTLGSNKFSFPIIFNNQIYFSQYVFSGTGANIVRYDPITNQTNQVVSSTTIGLAIYSLCVFNNYLYVNHSYSSSNFKIGRISTSNVFSNVYNLSSTTIKHCTPRALVVFNNEIYCQQVYSYRASRFIKSADGLTWNILKDYSFPFITGQGAYLEVIGNKVYTRDSDNIYSTSDFINWTRVSSNSFLTEEIGEFDNKYFLVKKSFPREIHVSSNLDIPLQIEEVSPTIVAVGNNPNSIIFAGGYLWTINYGPNNVSKIDINTNTVVATIAVGSNPQHASFDGTHIWVTNNAGSSVSKVDINTNAVVATVTVGSAPKGIVFAENHIWVVNSGSNNVSKIDINTNTVVATITVGTTARYAAFDGTYIWVTNWGGNIYKINATTNVKTIISSTPERVNSIIFDGTNIWTSQGEVIGSYYAYLYKYNISTNAIISSKVISSSYGMTSLGNYIWLSSYQTDSIIKVDKDTLNIVLTLEVGDTPYSIVSDGNDLWTANYNSMNVSKVIGTLNSPPEQTWESVYIFGDNLSYTSRFKQFGNYLYLGISAANQIYPAIYRSAGLDKIYRTFTEDFNLSEILNVGYRFVNSEILDIQSGVKTTRDIIARVIDYINLESLIYHRKNIYQVLNSLFVNISDFAQRNLGFRRILNNDINIESVTNYLKKIVQSVINEIWIDSLSQYKLYLKRILDSQIEIYSGIKSNAIYKRILESFINISEELISKAIYKRILEESVNIISESYFLRRTKEIVLDIVNIVSDVFHKKEIKYQFESDIEISTNVEKRGFLKRILENFVDISTGEQRNIIFKRILDSAIEIASTPLSLITKLSIVNEDFWIDSQVLAKRNLRRILDLTIEIYSQKIKLIDYIKILSNNIDISSINPIPHISKTLQETLNIISEVIASRKLLGILSDIINLETNFIPSRKLVRITNKTINIYKSLKLATFKAYSEGINISTNTFHLNILRRYLNEIIEIPTSIVQKVGWIKIFQENIEVSTLISRFLTLKRLLSEKVEIWKVVLRRTGLRRFLNESINIVSGVVDRKILPKIVQDILNISTNVGYVKNLFEILTDQISINTQEISYKIYKRILETFENISETVIEVFSGYIIKNIPESMNLNEGLTSKAIYKRILNESINIVENLPNTIFKLVRILNNYLDITEKVQIPIKLVLSEVVNLVDSALSLKWYISKYLQMLVGCDSTDLSSYENALTLYGNVYFDYNDIPPDKDGCSLVFGGYSDFIRANNGDWCNFSLQTWKIGFWVKPTTYSEDAIVFYVGNSEGEQFTIILTENKFLEIYQFSNLNTVFYLSSYTEIPLDEWTYLEIRQDKTSVSIFINGNLNSFKIQNATFGPYSGDAIIGLGLKGKLHQFAVSNSIKTEEIIAHSPRFVLLDDIPIFILNTPDKKCDKNEYEAIKEGVIIFSPTMTLAQTEGAEVFPIENDEIILPELKDEEVYLGEPQKAKEQIPTKKGEYIPPDEILLPTDEDYAPPEKDWGGVTTTGDGTSVINAGIEDTTTETQIDTRDEIAIEQVDMTYATFRLYYAEKNVDYWRLMYIDPSTNFPPSSINVGHEPTPLNIGSGLTDQAESPYVFYDSYISKRCFLYYSVTRPDELRTLAYRRTNTTKDIPDELNLEDEKLLRNLPAEIEGETLNIEDATSPVIWRKPDYTCRLYYIFQENKLVYQDVLESIDKNPPDSANFLGQTFTDTEPYDDVNPVSAAQYMFILPYEVGSDTYYRVYEYHDRIGSYGNYKAESSYRDTLVPNELPDFENNNLSQRVKVSFNCKGLFIIRKPNNKYRIYFFNKEYSDKRKVQYGYMRRFELIQIGYRDTKDTNIPSDSNLDSQINILPIDVFPTPEGGLFKAFKMDDWKYRCYYSSLNLRRISENTDVTYDYGIYYSDTIYEDLPNSTNIVDINANWYGSKPKLPFSSSSSKYRYMVYHSPAFDIIRLDSGKYRVYIESIYADTTDENMPGQNNFEESETSNLEQISFGVDIGYFRQMQIFKNPSNDKFRVYGAITGISWYYFIHQETTDIPNYEPIMENTRVTEPVHIPIRNVSDTGEEIINSIFIEKFKVTQSNPQQYYRIYVGYNNEWIGYVDTIDENLPDENNVLNIPIIPFTWDIVGNISDYFKGSHSYSYTVQEHRNTHIGGGIYKKRWVTVYKTASYDYYLFTYEDSGIKKIARRSSTSPSTDIDFLNIESSISKWQVSPYIRTYLNNGDKKIVPYYESEVPEIIASSTSLIIINKLIEVLG